MDGNKAHIRVGTRVINVGPASVTVIYGEGVQARTVKRGVIGVVTAVHPRVPSAGRGFPAIPMYYTVAIDGVDTVAMDKGDERWEVLG